MIDTVNETTTCKACGRPIVQGPGGHRKRVYCNAACKMRDRRRQNAEKQQPTLEQQNIAILQAKLTAAGAHIAKLERQVEVQRGRIGELTAENRTLRTHIKTIQLANERFRNDTQVRAFGTWLPKHAHYYAQTSFGQRFLADRKALLFPPQASRADYEQRLKNAGYLSEEIETFREAWREMLKTQF